MDKVLLSSKKFDWATPQAFYDKLDKEFHFTIDVCASVWNAKHSRFWGPVQDALTRTWLGERCFMNPPYGREIKQWVKKAFDEAQLGALVVALIPSRTDTSYWHDYIEGKQEVRFIRGRIKFETENGPMDAAPFPSAVVIFQGVR